MVPVGEESACFFKFLEDCSGAFALHDALVAYRREVQRNLTVFGESLDVTGHRVANVDARRVRRDHEATRVAVIDEEVDVVAGDLVGGELHMLPQVKFRGVRIEEALDFFGCDDAVALVVFEDVDNAAVSTTELAELLFERQEQILVEAPVQEGAVAVHVLDLEDCEFTDGRVGLVEGRDGAVFGIHVDEYIENFTLLE